MDARVDINGTLILSYDKTGLAKWLFGAAAVFLAIAGYDHFISFHGTDRMIGLLAGAGICVLAGLALHETARVRVDPAAKTITWSRHIAFWRRGGTLKFSEVRDVIVETPTGTRHVPSQRISLRLSDGSLLPLTYGCGPDADGHIKRSAELFRRALGQPGEPSAAASAQVLVELGRFTEAVRLLVSRGGLSLTGARQQVEAMKYGRGCAMPDNRLEMDAADHRTPQAKR